MPKYILMTVYEKKYVLIGGTFFSFHKPLYKFVDASGNHFHWNKVKSFTIKTNILQTENPPVLE